MGNLPFKLVVGALVVIVAGSILFSERFIVLQNRPAIAHLSSVRIPPELGDSIGALDSYGVHLRREHSKFETMLRAANTMLGHPPAPDSFANMTEPALGYSVREWSFLGLPFGYSTEYAHVLYVRNDWGTIYSPLTPQGWEMLDKANKRDLKTGNLFPFWMHLWGWGVVLLGLGALWLWHRGNVRRREEYGLID